MLAEEGDDLASIEVPKDLGPEGSSSASAESSKPSESKPEPKEEKKPEQKVEQKTVGGGHREIHHPKPLFPSVSRL